MDSCFICKKLLTIAKVVEVKTKGLANLLVASVSRGDVDNENMLRGVDSVRVHVTCRRDYTDSKMISAAVRRRSKGITPQPSTSAAVEAEVPQEMADRAPDLFDYEHRCFFCGEFASSDYASRHKLKISMITKRSVQETFVEKLQQRNDDFACAALARIRYAPDLTAVGARYHRECAKRIYREKTTQPIGRPASNNVDDAMKDIYAYLDDNADECQFSVCHLIEQVRGEYKPTVPTVKRRLEEHYGQELMFYESRGMGSVVCFKSLGDKLLRESLNTSNINSEEEIVKLMRQAGRNLRRYIRTKVYDTSSYPASDEFLDGVHSVIPEALNAFLDEVIINGKRGNIAPWKRLCTTIAHLIIHGVRPRSFLSQLRLAVGVFIYKQFGSRLLINVLFSLGISAPYSDIRQYEMSVIERPTRNISNNGFMQFVFDNADFNINTLDGHNTFHGMGGIHCVTPSSAIERDVPIARSTRAQSTVLSDEYGKMEIIPYPLPKNAGLNRLIVRDVAAIRPISCKVLPTIGDFMWLYGKWSCRPNIPGWNGFMQKATAEKPFERTKIVFLPFIHDSPSDYSTINTSLHLAASKAQRFNQVTCYVTFDQPLYWKARDIVAAPETSPALAHVIVRLGGFHLLLSFFGAVGCIMSGSGLEDVLQLIYAPNCVGKILSGHAYSRAVRAHCLVHLSLAKIIIDLLDLSDEERQDIDYYLTVGDGTLILSASTEESVQRILQKFEEKLEELERTSPTAKLWVQYFKLITLIKHFIEAERTGDWSLHLHTIQQMLPIFYASGHHLYAKSVQLYLQDMLCLEESMPAEEYQSFTGQGKFTIRLTDKYWCGMFSDQAIECGLMKELKLPTRGLTHGRGITENSTRKWTLGMLSLIDICTQVETFCGVSTACSEQHVDMRPVRVVRDNSDVEKLDHWFAHHQPFTDNPALLSISTGLTGTSDINCHMAFEVGRTLMAKNVGKPFDSLTYKRADKILPLAAVPNTIKIHSTKVVVHPVLLFQRMCIAKQSDDDLKHFLSYELAPYPMSLFSDEGMRKGTKATLYTSFTPKRQNFLMHAHRSEVVDGGWLLHKVVWNKHATVHEICEQYVAFLRNHFCENVIVIFDGYPDNERDWGTKTHERLRRATKLSSPDYTFDESTVPPVAQEKFIANEKNKKKFIAFLAAHLRRLDIHVLQAVEDGDTLIVSTALERSSMFDEVYIIGEDVDLLVLLVGLHNESTTNVYMRKPSRGRVAEHIYSTTSFKHSRQLGQWILFIHAFTGCDTTSAMYNLGKGKLISVLLSNPDLEKFVSEFYNKRNDCQSVAFAGERIMIAVYGGDMNEESLNSLRYKKFVKSTAKIKTNLASLPPTTDAAKYHSLRSYHQVQMWLGNYLDADEWGWEKSEAGWISRKSSKDPAPSELLKLISCSCGTPCRAACGCRKAGLKCTVICKHCAGETCENVQPSPTIVDNDSDCDDDDEDCTSYEAQKEDDNSESDEPTPGPSKKRGRFE